jgi:hypothetical protein
VKARNGPAHEPVRTAEGIAPSNGRVERTESRADGAVVGAPRRWLGLEGATLFVGALVGYSTTHQAWWLVPITILLPDLSMLGYLRGTRLGARVYNLAHSTPLPAAVVAIGWWQEKSVVTALGLVWLAHIGLDRLIGYGLKYDDHFQHTHLGRLGRHG